MYEVSTARKRGGRRRLGGCGSDEDDWQAWFSATNFREGNKIKTTMQIPHQTQITVVCEGCFFSTVTNISAVFPQFSEFFTGNKYLSTPRWSIWPGESNPLAHVWCRTVDFRSPQTVHWQNICYNIIFIFMCCLQQIWFNQNIRLPLSGWSKMPAKHWHNRIQ